ncbi:MAG: glycosyltransferase family 2 protein [Aggregatilineales bacterium]
MSTLLFSVVIPNWNGLAHLPTCLAALRTQTYPCIEAIVVDNASTDGSQAFIQAQFPEVRLIELPENRGFTGACNAGLRAAHGAILALLNNDTEADPHWVEEVVACFARHPEAGLVASKMLLFDRRDTLHTAGDFYTLDGRAGNRGVWQHDAGQFEREEYVFSACGGAAAYRRTMLDQIGLLDDDFFFSLEDVDLAWRANLADWRCVYAPRAIVYHKLSATGGGVTASFYDGRNALWVIAKNYPAFLWRKHWRRVLAAQSQTAWKALRAWRGAASRAKLRGMLAGLLGLPRMLKKRRLIQAHRRIGEEALEALLTDMP